MDAISTGSFGFGSGIDTSALISALLDVERIPSVRINAERTRLSDETRFFGQLEQRLDALVERLKDIATPAELASNVVESSDESAIGVEGSAALSSGSHRLTVEQLARAGSQASVGVTSPVLQLPGGEFSITVGSNTYDLSVVPASLDGVAAAIEASGAPVTATVVNTGIGAAPYRLVVTADETGVANDFSFDFSNARDLGDALGLTSLQTARDAEFTLDGLSVSRASNQVNDLIAGVTLDLHRVTDSGEEITVSVGPDNDLLKEKIQGFLEAYNSVADLVGSRFKTDENGATTSVLFGDSGLRSLQSRLRSAATESTGSGDVFESLAELGIRTDSSGRLTLDETRFDAALASDREGLVALFADETSGVAQRIDATVATILDQSDGLLAVRRDGIERRDRVLGQRLDVLDRRLLLVEQRLIDRFSALERLVSELNSQGAALGSL